MSTLRGRGTVQGLPEWDRCAVMGVVNVTPDSFSDGGRWFDTTAAIKHGLDLVAEGADLVDVGGESTRPGASRVDESEELRRVVPVVRELARGRRHDLRGHHARPRRRTGRRRRCGPRQRCERRARRPGMIPVVAASGTPFVVMHWRGFSEAMNSRAVYEDVVAEVVVELRMRMDAVVAGGVAPERIVVDPGLGFAKDAEHDLALVAHLDELRVLGRPLLVAASRKRFLGHVLAGARAPPRRPPANATRPPPRSPPWPPRPAPGRSGSTRSGPPPTPYGSPALSREPRERAPRRPGGGRRRHRGGRAGQHRLLRGDGARRSRRALRALAARRGVHDPRPRVSCVHPGWPVLTGRGEVLRSYALIMANTEYIQFFLTDVRSPSRVTRPW